MSPGLNKELKRRWRQWIPVCLAVAFHTSVSAAANEPAQPRGFSIPLIDLAGETERQVIIDRDGDHYLGHPTTVLLEDKRTMIAVYPEGHGRGRIIMKRSTDGGLTWSDRLPTPKSWATSQEIPTIHRVIGPDGKKRLILFSGLYPCRMAVSEDDGQNWSELKPVGDWGGICTMTSVVALKTGKGKYMAMFHDDEGYFKKGGRATGNFTVYKTFSDDGGLTWSFPEAIVTENKVHLCEAGVIRSPDGKQLAALMRENSRRRNSYVFFSNDEGQTWTKPRELPGALTGDRHVGKYAPDGRLFVTFRDTTHESPTPGDWAGWIGTYDDLVKGKEGQYRLRLMDDHSDGDCGYPAIELLGDGTIVTTTYGHWLEGQPPFIASVRFKMEELDARAKQMVRPLPPGFLDSARATGGNRLRNGGFTQHGRHAGYRGHGSRFSLSKEKGSWAVTAPAASPKSKPHVLVNIRSTLLDMNCCYLGVDGQAGRVSQRFSTVAGGHYQLTFMLADLDKAVATVHVQVHANSWGDYGVKPQQAARKTQYALDHGLGGVMLFGFDTEENDTSMIQAVRDTLIAHYQEQTRAK